jgi:crooked neck
MSFAQFELSAAGGEGAVERARRVYEKANQALRSAADKEERVLLLEAWREFEIEHGDEESLAKLKSRLPRRIKRRQKVQADDGVRFLLFLISNNTI